MTSPPLTVPNVLGATNPGLGLFPPGGAYFGYTTVLNNSSGACSGLSGVSVSGSQNYCVQSANTFYVYWVNGTTPPFYLLIHKQTATFSAGMPLLNVSTGRFYMMTGAWIGASVQDSNSADAVTLGRTSPDTGATIASVSESMMLNVPGSQGSQAANRPFTAVDEASLNLMDWTVLNQATLLPGSLFWTSSAGTQWFFCETTPWNPTTQAGLSDPSSFLDSNNNTLPFSLISQSSLPVTTYTTWTITNPNWTSTTPATASVTVQVYLNLWAAAVVTVTGGPFWYVGAVNGGGVSSPIPQPAPIPLQLDQIATKVPSGD